MPRTIDPNFVYHLRFAAKQRRKVACAFSHRSRIHNAPKLRSSDITSSEIIRAMGLTIAGIAIMAEWMSLLRSFLCGLPCQPRAEARGYRTWLLRSRTRSLGTNHRTSFAVCDSLRSRGYRMWLLRSQSRTLALSSPFPFSPTPRMGSDQCPHTRVLNTTWSSGLSCDDL